MKLVGNQPPFWPLWCRDMFKMRAKVERLVPHACKKAEATPGLEEGHVGSTSMVVAVSAPVARATFALLPGARARGIL